uniref:Exostosin-like 2 n=1 Tax=Periophthalmus magnuspinnatus TaxID=409849 RepID=A0A3B4AMS7_9GOBI
MIPRRGYMVLSLLLVLLLVGGVLMAFVPSAEKHQGADFRQHSNPGLTQSHKQHRMVEESKFTIIMQTYNRTDVLLKLLNHYQAMPHLQRIIIVWNNIGEPTPQKLWDSLGPHPVPIVFKQQSTNLMRNRLQSFKEIDTDAVLMLDDDTLVSVPDVSFAFSVWNEFTVMEVLSYRTQKSQEETGKYSMVLIGAAFFHRRYLQLFQEQDKAVLALIDETQNCDDIVMNFVVSLYLKKIRETSYNRPSGVFVKPVDMRNLEKDASSGYQGMWHRPEHLLQRSYCLNRLAHIYGVMPLCFSNLMVSQFGFPSYANHKSRG